LGGGALGKVSATLAAYEDSNKTAVVNVTADFAASDQVTIAGLKFANFTAVSSADNLELVVSGSGGTTEDEDDKTITIVAPPPTKLYFHDAATPNTGTLPAATTLSATTPNVTAPGAGINRDMDETIGTAQASSALTTAAQTALQRNWYRRFLSRPLAAQTLPTGVWTIQGGASESNAASNMFPWGAVISVWRPSTGAPVATLLDSAGLGAVEAGTAETNISTPTGSLAGVAVNDGDVLVMELWAPNLQGNATARTNTVFYDGTTEGSTTSNAAYLLAPGAITFYRSTRQSAYRLFNNANSTDVGAPLAAQDTAATLGSTGAAFRVRLLLHVADITLGTSGQAYKLQFVGKGTGTCAAPSGGTPAVYTDVTAATAIAYNNNAAPADGATLTANASDPTHGSDTVVNQSYEELNTFTNLAAIVKGQDGKWDFSLIDNGAPASTTFCLRAVKSTGTALDTYIVFPEITTSVVSTPGSFNAFETSTAASATSGQIYMKRSGVNFAFDVVAILSGAQLASFTNTVQVDLVTGSTGGANCPGTPVQISGTAQSITLTGGRGITGNFNLSNAYPNVRARIRYPVSSPTVTSCSTDNFSIRPSSITLTSTDATNNATTGTPAIKTGASFSLTASTGVAGYNGTPGIDNSLVIGSPNAGTIGGAFSAASAATGTATGSSFFYSEAGNFGLSANAVRDTTFTAVDQSSDCTADFSNALVSGKYGCNFGSTAIAMTVGSSGFGRFIPDNFNVIRNTPSFTTSCGGASGFTYVGQSLPYTVAPQMTVTARSGTANGLTNTTTTNYAGAYMKLANSGTSLNQAPYNTQAGRYARFDALGGATTPALDTVTLPATTSDPAIGTFTNGAGTLTFASGLALVRPTSRVAPFSADIALSLNIVDSDGVIFAANPAAFGQVLTAGGGIAFSGSKSMRFGILRLENAVGSEKLDLPVPIQTQYYTGTTFTRNTDDNCTSISAANIAFSSYFGGITATNMNSANISGLGATFSSGFGSLTLAKPSPTPASAGAVTLTIDLTAEAKSYLKGNWGVPAYTADPNSRAAFGLYGSQGQPNNFIYFRENY
jgi:hypothetical protein